MHTPTYIYMWARFLFMACFNALALYLHDPILNKRPDSPLGGGRTVVGLFLGPESGREASEAAPQPQAHLRGRAARVPRHGPRRTGQVG